LVGEIAIVAFTYLIGVGSTRARLKFDARALDSPAAILT